METTKRTETVPFDAGRLLDRPEDVAAFVADALESGHSGYIQHALGVAARARGMGEIAEKAGLSRESLYRALREDANPRFDTVLKVLHAMGLHLAVQLEKPAEAA